MGVSLHILFIELSLKFINVLGQNQLKEVLGIRIYFNFTMTYVPAEHRQNTGYIFFNKIYKYIL